MGPTAGRPSVVYWNNIPSPYVVERFNELAARDRLRFEAWFSARTEPDRSWEVDEAGWRFRHRYVPAPRLSRRLPAVPTGLLGKHRPDVLVSLYDHPSYLLAQMVSRAGRTRTALWVEATFDRWVRRRPWREAVKRWLFPAVDGILVPGPDAWAFACRYGARPGSVHTVPQVIDVEHYRGGRARALAGRDRRRAELNLRGVTFMYVGRMWSGKGVGYLLHAFGRLQRRLDAPVSLLLVGDGVDEHGLRRLSERSGLENVVFAGFRQKAELPAWYALADVFVFPTLGDPYGLVVDEAMACSLPVVSTTEAGELALRVEDGANGYLVPPQDSSALLSRMEVLARSPELRARMGERSYAKVRNLTPSLWADAFEHAVQRILSAPSRAGRSAR